MTFTQSFIVQKLGQMKEYLEEAKLILALPVEEILGKPTNLRSLERLLQLIVDSALDINKHFIKELNLQISDDLQSTFIVLGENNILPNDFAQKIAPVVGLRNRLVHRYEKVDNKRFIADFEKNQQDFDNFINYISSYLEKQSG